MALYTIGDFHLSFSADKPMDVFGLSWENHAEKLRNSFSMLKPDDLTVICGDLSWAMNLEAALADFRFIDSLPGRKIVLKGNHDYWWSTASKANSFFVQNNINTISVLHNNSFEYNGYHICGTRGWFYEEERNGEHDLKIMLRELGRLKRSLESAGETEKLVFLHYPPLYQNYVCSEIFDILSEHRVRKCYYGHLHGKSCLSAYNGTYRGVELRLVSADSLDFTPIRVI